MTNDPRPHPRSAVDLTPLGQPSTASDPAYPPHPAPPNPADDVCDVCGSDRLAWRSCKLMCGNCRSILKSCADL